MAKELERKFLLKEGYDNFFDNFTKQYIEQGYLMLMPGKQLRVRITDNKKQKFATKNKQTIWVLNAMNMSMKFHLKTEEN